MTASDPGWWLGRRDLVANLADRSVAEDPSITQMSPRDICRTRALRERVASDLLKAIPILAYRTIADTHDGRIDLVAVFESNPFASLDPIVNESQTIAGWHPENEPRVFALNGPTRSPHRQPERKKSGYLDPERGGCLELCLYYDEDPAEWRWRAALGVLGLFDIAKRHLEAEHVWRSGRRWPLRQAPHGRTTPAKRALHRLIRPDELFGRAA